MNTYSETPDIFSISSHQKINVLSPSELETLKNGTLQLLSEVGVSFPTKKALTIFAEHGADVDWEKEIVRIPPDLVKKAMATAPRSFVLGGREKRFDLTLDGKVSYLTTDGCGVHVIDPETREKRASQKADVAMMARVGDALPAVSFFWPMVSAQDFGKTAPLHECHAGLTSTLKHVRGGTTVHPELAPAIVEMATVVSGSEAERRLRPPVCANICTIAPMTQDAHGIETALIYAEAGIPQSFMAMPTMGSTAPASVLGAIVQGDAEVISAMVLMQLAHPGAPVIHSIITSIMNPRTGGYIGDLNLPVNFIAAELAHAWNVPTLGGGSFSSDAPDLGWQSAFETGFGSSQIPLAGGELCGYMGLMSSSMILYPEQLILDNAVAMDVYTMYKKFDFQDLDVSLDVIKAVGPKGHFLREKHTRKHIRDFHYSPIFRQLDAAGSLREPREVAIEEFKKIYNTHNPEPLPDSALKEMDQIVAAADRKAKELGE
ncbi:MAG: trimethylamine methyltransferase family protein [Anaerolineales bacterium]|uniref:Trimethylamine methyltransferase family protein n=1 Tax=Candidatus Desulfolinea nitratireducens TaxID=2841698 RepID=A0A8J6TI00_9CHLR|nr:trimethylamine methyltransferase family protein [Candidatus Desulfolinea nitratireducens]